MEQQKHVTYGPFGGLEGNPWYEGMHRGGIMNIKIWYKSAINGIQIEYADHKWTQPYGGCDGAGHVVAIHEQGEYIRSIWGYYCTDSALQIVQSLTIETNKYTHGPFGTEKGKYFKIPFPSGIFNVGCFGRSGSKYLNSFGAYFNFAPGLNIFRPPMIVGPFGNYDGGHWDDGIHTAVTQIIIRANEVVNSIRIEYDDNGQRVWGNIHGDGVEGDQHEVQFDYPNEFLFSIEGYYSLESSIDCIQSLTIHSSKKSYGPYGTETGKHFMFPPPGGSIIGLHGKSGHHLDSIGAYYLIENRICDQFIDVGPFGGPGGDEWDDGKYSAVKKIIISAGSLIHSIQIEYSDDKGNSKCSEKHGKSQGTHPDTIQLGPDEYLISISGHYSELNKNVVVRSLTIESNKKAYGPYGVKVGSPFKSPTDKGKIVGFFGRSGDWLDSIGAHFKP